MRVPATYHSKHSGLSEVKLGFDHVCADAKTMQLLKYFSQH